MFGKENIHLSIHSPMNRIFFTCLSCTYAYTCTSFCNNNIIVSCAISVRFTEYPIFLQKQIPQYMNLKIQTIPWTIQSLTAVCGITHSQVEVQNAWINNLVQQTLSMVHIFVHPFSCNWFTHSCCSFDNNAIHKVYKKLAILGPTEAGCYVHFVHPLTYDSDAAAVYLVTTQFINCTKDQKFLVRKYCSRREICTCIQL